MAEPPRLVVPPPDGEEAGDPARPSADAAPTPLADGDGEARRLLSDIVASSDDAILSKDLDGVVTSWNAGAEAMYGYSAAEVIGRSVSLLVPPEREDDTPRLLERLRRGERIRHYETIRRAKDGRRLTVSLTLSPLRDGAGRIVGASAIGRDITDRVLEASRWRLLSELGEALGRVLDGEELLRELARLLVREMGDYCVTYLLEEGRIRRIGAAHADPAMEPLVGRLVELAPPSLDDPAGAGAVIRTGEAILAPEVLPAMLEKASRGAEHLRLLRDLAPVSSMVLPLRARGHAVGAVAISATTRSGRRYRDADLVLGRELADRAALALDNARLYGAARGEVRLRQAAEASLRRRYGHLRVLYEMTEAVGRAGELEEVYQRSLDGLRHGLGVERAAILLFDGEGVMRFEAWRGLSDAYRAAVEGHSPWPRDAAAPAPVVVADAAADPGLEPALRETVLAEGIRSIVFVPLVFGGRLLGKFMLYGDAPGAPAEEEMELARTLAGTIAFAITRVRDERSVREAKEAAERANEAKSQFLGIMSHELRTPLNAVLGYAELLLLETRGPVNDAQRAQLERIQASARHQLELVEELLAYTRLEAGREEPRWIDTDAGRVVRDVVELVRPEAEAKGLHLSLDLPDAPLPVVTDPAKLRQVVLNLAGNATKYTEAGEVEISARLAGGRLRVSVRDTGPGIPADRLEYIFEPFARVDESRTRSTEGSGLGLAISRRVAALLGGTVTVWSRPGAGSTFTIDLPASGPGGDA